MKKVLVVAILFIHLVLPATSQEMTLKDSILQYYSLEELRQMSSHERGNIIRKFQGLKPLPEPVAEEEPEFDFYGVKIIKQIPKDSIELVIDDRVERIKEEQESYKQEVFPNAWRDVVEGFGLYFYNSITERTKSEDDEVISELIENWSSVTGSSPFSDFSRRIYYFNKEGALRLITREMGYNILSGEPDKIVRQMERVYYFEERYIWDDTLQYSCRLKCMQYVGGYPDYTTQEAIDTTSLDCASWKTHHYKNNCFNLHKKEGKFPPYSWRKDFALKPFKKYGDCENGSFISVRNLLLEREEYHSRKNNYLQPVPTSEWQPYVIEGEWNPTVARLCRVTFTMGNIH
jgi:hypothetical protein